MLTPEQRTLWRNIVILYALNGLIIVLSLIFDIRVGFGREYFREAYTGQVEALLHSTTVLDYAGNAFLVLIVVLPRMFLALYCVMLMGQAFILPEQVYTKTLLQSLIISGFSTLMLTTLCYYYVLFYAPDTDRATFVLLIKVCNFLYSLMYGLGIAVNLYSLHTRRLVPRRLIYLASGILLIAFLYSMVAHHPNYTQFFTALIAYIAGLVIIAYMALVLNSRQSIPGNTPPTR